MSGASFAVQGMPNWSIPKGVRLCVQKSLDGTVSTMNTTTTRRGRALTAIATGALMLAACGQGKEALPAAKEASCDKTDVIEALSKPMTTATSVKYEHAPEEGAAAPKIVELARGKDKSVSISYKGIDANYVIGSPSRVIYTKTGMYALLADGVVEGVAKDEWVRMGDPSVASPEQTLETVSPAIDDFIDDAITGSESVTPGVYQLGESINLKDYKVTTVAREEGACEYQLSSSSGYKNLNPITARVDDEGRILGVEASQGTTITFGYDEYVIETPKKLNSVALDVVTNGIKAFEGREVIAMTAREFDQELRALAAGQSGKKGSTEVSPQDASLIVTAATDYKHPDVTLSVKGKNSKVFVLWDGTKNIASTADIAPLVDKVQLSGAEFNACILVSADSSTPSEVAAGDCRW